MTSFVDYIGHRSPTCPQCRERCDISFIKRTYFDFAPDEPKPSTSRAAIEWDTRKRELERVLRSEGEAEDTIRQLLEVIDDESMRTEEYTNQLADFDAQSEEISKLKSLIEESSEVDKSLLDTIDELNEKIATLEEALQEERRRNLHLHADNHDKEVELGEIAIKLQSIEHTLESTEQQRDRVTEKANQAEWNNIQNANAIEILTAQGQEKSRELLQLQLKFDYANAKLESLEEIVRDQKTQEDRFLQKMHALFGEHFLSDRMLKEMNCGKVFSKNGLSTAVAPFCGNIKEWRFMVVPLLSTFPYQSQVSRSNHNDKESSF